MKTVTQHATLGTIEYEESFWTGKKKLSINGVALNKIGKNDFQTESGEKVVVVGDYLRGAKMFMGGQTVALTPAVKWYDLLLSALGFALNLVWGNSITLCSIIPVVGGFIGGFISVLLGFINVLIIKGIKSVPIKILVSLGTLVLSFVICAAIGFLIVIAVAA